MNYLIINLANKTRQFVYAICLSLFGFVSHAATNPLIDNVDLEDDQGFLHIHINFVMPVALINHYPPNKGKQLDLSIRPIPYTTDDKTAITQAQRLGFKSKKINTLQLIRYEPANPSGRIVSVVFNQATSYEIMNQNRPDQITIRVIKKPRKPDLPEIEPGPSTKDSPLEDSNAFIYCINLLSTKKTIILPDSSSHPELTPFFVYKTRLDAKSTNWHRLRLGFFKTLPDARQVLKRVKSNFPNAWIDRATGSERKYISPWLATLAASKNNIAFRQETDSNNAINSNQFTTKTQQMFASAKKSIIDGHYRTAIRVLTKLLRLPDNESTEAAHELLGVAREKNRQIAHAIAEYRIYLKKYPKGEFSYRVKQRLDGLTSARRKTDKRLRRLKPKYKETPLQVYGSVFQFYRRDVDTTDPSNNITTNSSLATDVSVSTRKRTKKHDLRSQFTASYQYDLENSNQSQFRISSMYFDASDRKRIWHTRIGRQSKSTGGVLGRFDGITAGYRISPKWKINAVSGFPVSISTSNQLNTDKRFFGTSLDIGTFDKYWNGSIFLIKQSAYNLDDRTAAGLELRYLNPKLTVFGLLDVDIDYKNVNIAQLISNIRFANATTLNLVADYRNSPILTTSNALQGQTVSSLDALLQTYTEEQIRQLAEDRTAIFRSISATLSKPIKKDLLLSLEFSASHLTNTPASGGVDASPGSGIEYFYGTQLIANNVFKKGDTSLFGLRYADTNASQTTTLSINSRYPYNKKWRLNPRMRVDIQERQSNASITKYRPSLRIDWRKKRNLKFEMEAGYEYSDISDSVGDREESSFFINLGYIADF